MSDIDPVIFVCAMVTALMLGALAGTGYGSDFEREKAREKFLTFCTSQNIPYAKCKEEWEKP